VVWICRTFCTTVNSAGREGSSITSDDVINFLSGAVIVGNPSESVDVATLEPRAKNGQAVRCTECE